MVQVSSVINSKLISIRRVICCHRFCAQVYNVKEDYKRLADAVAEVIENTSH